jgi:DNA-binding NarL/FixJ family response regulator
MADPVKVLVLYDHPLLGEGLGALMASVPELEVERIAMGDPGAMERAMASEADVVILEEGGPVGLVDLLRDSRCRAIVDVSISTSQAWTIRREAIAPDPESLIDRIISACLGDRRSNGAATAAAATAAAATAPSADPAAPPSGQAKLAAAPAVG